MRLDEATNGLVERRMLLIRLQCRIDHPHKTDVCLETSDQWRTQRGGVRGVQTPPLNLQKNLYCVLAKYTLQALLLCSLNPKFYTGKR